MTQGLQVTLSGTTSEMADFADAVVSMSVLMNNAENAFGFLALLHEHGDHTGHIGFGAIAHLCCRALASCGDKEGAMLEKLANRLRNSQPRKEAM